MASEQAGLTMLENLNLDRKLPREDYQKLLPGLQRRLYDLEKACWDHAISSIVVFEGWEAAGKGGAIANLSERLDPRGFKLHAIQLPRTFEQQRPWLYRFWLRAPNRGEMAIFDQSWYMRVLVERVEGLAPKPAWRAAYQDILDFERMLADDGTVLIKFFFHISRKEQGRRFRKLLQDPLEAWRVDKAARRQHRKYAEWLEAVEQVLELTESEFAPWTIVEATSRWWARNKVFETIITALEKRLGSDAPSTEAARQAADREADLRQARRTLEGENAGEG